MARAGMEDAPMEFGVLSKTIESVQTRVEGYNFDMRKNVVEYDDVMSMQRQAVEHHLDLTGICVIGVLDELEDGEAHGYDDRDTDSGVELVACALARRTRSSGGGPNSYFKYSASRRN